MVSSIIAKVENMEVRKATVEERTIPAKEEGKKDITYRYIEIHFDDENLDRHVFKDKQVELHENLYKRGDVGTLYLEIITEDVSKKDTTFIQEKTKVLIHDFVPNKE